MSGNSGTNNLLKVVKQATNLNREKADQLKDSLSISLIII
jgi:hypothetical protein